MGIGKAFFSFESFVHLAKKSNIRIPNYLVKCLLNNSNQTSEKKTSRIVQMKKVLKVQC